MCRCDLSDIIDIIYSMPFAAPKILTWRDAGLLGPDVIFSHCNCLFNRTEPDDEMWAAMRDNECAIASTPVDELGMQHGNPVAIDAVRRGVKCGLGAVRSSSNCTESCNLKDMHFRTVHRSMAETYSHRCDLPSNSQEVRLIHIVTHFDWDIKNYIRERT